MKNLSKDEQDCYMILFREYSRFAENPTTYFAKFLDMALSEIMDEFETINVESITKKIAFIKFFVKNWNTMTDKNVSKILKYGAKESSNLLLVLYSRIDLFSDLVRSKLLEGNVMDMKTMEIHPILYGIQDNFLTALNVIEAFLGKYQPTFNIDDCNNTLQEIYNETIDSDKVEISVNDEQMYS